MNIFDDLNTEQLEAVNYLQGPLRIIAGPGSGKTKTIISKIAKIILEGHANVNEVLIITFTNKAANEIRERLKNIIGDREDYIPKVYTYHGWAARFLRIEYKKIESKNPDYRILDTQDVATIVKNLSNEMYEGEVDFKDAIPLFTKYQYIENQLSDDLKEKDTLNNKIALLYQKYIEKKEQLAALDFDDLLTEVLKLLKEYPEISTYYKNRYKYIFIDEFQDTNNVQFDIIKHITNRNSNISVVGDADQNIYSWRGANFEIILNLGQYYDNLKTIVLNKNYRSTPSILNIANNLISHNKNRVEVNLKPTKSDDGKIEVYQSNDEYDEANFVVDKIISLVSKGECKLHDIAIIYRNNFLSRPFEAVLMQNSIPYKLVGGFKFFDRKEVKEVFNFLHFLIMKDDFSLSMVINVPARGVGDVLFAKIQNNASSYSSIWEYLNDDFNLSSKLTQFIQSAKDAMNKLENNVEVSEALNNFLDEIGFIKYYSDENKSENVTSALEEIKRSFEKYKGTLKQKAVMFFQTIALTSASDETTKKNSVTLITTHASKGTEFEAVFFVRFNSEIIPSYRSESNIKSLEEERRLAYVGTTRAKRFLTYSYITSPRYSYSSKSSGPSKFLNELGISTISNPKTQEEEFKVNVNSNNFGLTNGDKVVHTLWGEGIIIQDGNETITVAFNRKIGIKQLTKGHSSYKGIK